MMAECVLFSFPRANWHIGRLPLVALRIAIPITSNAAYYILRANISEGPVVLDAQALSNVPVRPKPGARVRTRRRLALIVQFLDRQRKSWPVRFPALHLSWSGPP